MPALADVQLLRASVKLGTHESAITIPSTHRNAPSMCSRHSNHIRSQFDSRAHKIICHNATERLLPLVIQVRSVHDGLAIFSAFVSVSYSVELISLCLRHRAQQRV
jgi:hypothetical protein